MPGSAWGARDAERARQELDPRLLPAWQRAGWTGCWCVGYVCATAAGGGGSRQPEIRWPRNGNGLVSSMRAQPWRQRRLSCWERLPKGTRVHVNFCQILPLFPVPPGLLVQLSCGFVQSVPGLPVTAEKCRLQDLLLLSPSKHMKFTLVQTTQAWQL